MGKSLVAGMFSCMHARLEHAVERARQGGVCTPIYIYVPCVHTNISRL